MVSVMNQIRQSREHKQKKEADIYIYETFVDDYPVRMRFGVGSDSIIMESIRSKLLSAHLDNTLAAASGGAFV